MLITIRDEANPPEGMKETTEARPSPDLSGYCAGQLQQELFEALKEEPWEGKEKLACVLMLPEVTSLIVTISNKGGISPYPLIFLWVVA